MTKDKTVTMSRELAEVFASPEKYTATQAGVAMYELHELLAAPAVERQEPVAEVVMVDPFVLSTGNLHLLRLGDKLYTSPPVQAAVVLPPRPHASDEEQQGMTEYEIGLGHGAMEMWDKVKEMNQ